MRLTLTSRSLRVGFTALGHRRVRRAAESAFAVEAGRGLPGRPAAAPVPRDPPEGDDDAAGPEKPFPLRDVQDVHASGDSLLVCFATRTRAVGDSCDTSHRVLITGLRPADAQRFAGAVRRVREQNVGARP